MASEFQKINSLYYLAVQTIFNKKDWALTLAENGQEALEIISREKFDLVLMYCQMPVMDGFKATQLIRKHEGSFRHTHIIAMTAHTLPVEIAVNNLILL